MGYDIFLSGQMWYQSFGDRFLNLRENAVESREKYPFNICHSRFPGDDGFFENLPPCQLPDSFEEQYQRYTALTHQDQKLQYTSLIDGPGMSQNAEPETSGQMSTPASLPDFRFQGIPTLPSKRKIHQMAQSQTFASSDSLHGTNGCQESSRWSAPARQNQSSVVPLTGNLSTFGALSQSVEIGKSVSQTSAAALRASGAFWRSVELGKSAPWRAPSLSSGQYVSIHASGYLLVQSFFNAAVAITKMSASPPAMTSAIGTTLQNRRRVLKPWKEQSGNFVLEYVRAVVDLLKSSGPSPLKSTDIELFACPRTLAQDRHRSYR
jgi:hypothetical protein